MKNHLVSEKFLSFSNRIKQPLPRLVIKVLLGSNTKKTQSQQNYDGVDATKHKEKYKFIGFPPNKRYCLTPLARHKSERITYRRLWCSNHKWPSSWIHKAILFSF